MRATRKPPRAGRVATFSESLSDAILRGGITLYQLGKMADVSPSVLSRFVRGERGLSTPTVDRLTTALGLHLVAAPRPKGRPRRAEAVEGRATYPEPAGREPGADSLHSVEIEGTEITDEGEITPV